MNNGKRGFGRLATMLGIERETGVTTGERGL